MEQNFLSVIGWRLRDDIMISENGGSLRRPVFVTMSGFCPESIAAVAPVGSETIQQSIPGSPILQCGLFPPYMMLAMVLVWSARKGGLRVMNTGAAVKGR